MSESKKKTKQNEDVSNTLREARNIICDVVRLLWNESMDHHDALKGSFHLHGMRVSAKEFEG